MSEYKNAIQRGYRVYLDKYPEYGTFSFGEDGYPLQNMALSDSTGSIANNIGDLERAALVEHRDDIPDISELPMDDLAWVPVGLTDILKVQRTADHESIWTESVYILSEFNSDGKPFPDQIVRNIETLVRAVLCKSWSPSRFHEDGWTSDMNRKHTLEEASVMARYMAFPTIEGMIKALCRRDIRLDGIVREDREVLAYKRDNYTEKDEVSNVGHLLWHLEQDVATEPLRSRLEDFRVAVCDFFKIDGDHSPAYGYISNQRNSVLHGQMRARAEFGILLNLISLIILNIDHIPEERRQLL